MDGFFKARMVDTIEGAARGKTVRYAPSAESGHRLTHKDGSMAFPIPADGERFILSAPYKFVPLDVASLELGGWLPDPGPVRPSEMAEAESAAAPTRLAFVQKHKWKIASAITAAAAAAAGAAWYLS
jgi:hypothetical protein